MSITFKDIYKTSPDVEWLRQPFTGFSLDSRKVEAGQIFIALKSYSDPNRIIENAKKALEDGAVGVISEQETGCENEWFHPSVRADMGQWQHDYLAAIDPVQKMRLLAVTGTNGKTTISRLIAELITLQHQSCAVFGTTGNGILPSLVASSHTTLDALQLQQLLHEFAKQGAQFAALEASSHGLEQQRLNGCDIEIAVYSNLSRDHLDYHGSLEAYADAKAQLFRFQSLKTVIINLDDDYAHQMQMAAQNNPSQPQILTYSSSQSQADYWVKTVNFTLSGAHIELVTPQGCFAIESPLLGQFNVENLIASLIAVEQLGFDFATLCPFVPQLKGAPGRMQVIRDGERLFVVDYAHTPDALTQVLNSLKRHTKNHLWAVFGCGGDRDRGKRPLMTQASLDSADMIVLTSDNPRSENITQILSDMKYGIDLSVHEVFELEDRREAIKFAVRNAKNGDIVVIAGKGHEDYQEINGTRHWFDDAIEVKSAIDSQAHSYHHGHPAS